MRNNHNNSKLHSFHKAKLLRRTCHRQDTMVHRWRDTAMLECHRVSDIVTAEDASPQRSLPDQCRHILQIPVILGSGYYGECLMERYLPKALPATSSVSYRLVTGLGQEYQQSVLWGHNRSSVIWAGADPGGVQGSKDPPWSPEREKMKKTAFIIFSFI